MKRRIMGFTIAAVLASGMAAHALDTVTRFSVLMNPDGGGPLATQNVRSLDWAPGSILIQDALPATVGDTFQYLYMSSLIGWIKTGDVNYNTVGLGSLNTNPGYEITLVAGGREQVTSVTPNGLGLGFQHVAGGTNFFEMYFDSTPDSNAATGAGFNDGTLMLVGQITNNVSNFTLTTDTITLPDGTSLTVPMIDRLDVFAGNNPPSIDANSVVGNGGGTLAVQVLNSNPIFFPESVSYLDFDLTWITQQILPFLTVDPSQSYYPGPRDTNYDLIADAVVTNSVLPDLPNVTTTTTPNSFFAGETRNVTNGIPEPNAIRDQLIELDGSNNFRVVQVVPEPGTMILLGSGLLGLASIGRRRTRAS